MNSRVVQFRPRAVDDRQTRGPLICELCNHREPEAVVPCGRKHFDCAKCGRMSAVRDGPVLPEEGVVRQSCATCGDQSFAVMLDALMCSSCGTIHKEDWQGAA